MSDQPKRRRRKDTTDASDEATGEPAEADVEAPAAPAPDVAVPGGDGAPVAPPVSNGLPSRAEADAEAVAESLVAPAPELAEPVANGLPQRAPKEQNRIAEAPVQQPALSRLRMDALRADAAAAATAPTDRAAPGLRVSDEPTSDSQAPSDVAKELVGDGPPPSLEPEDDSSKSTQRAVREWTVAIAVALVAAFAIKIFLFQAFVIPSGSMESTLEIGDRVVVVKPYYNFADPQRGQVVVFDNPDPLPGEPAQLIKRIVAIGGDSVESIDEKLYVNGTLVDESYLDPGTLTTGITRRTVPLGHVFVLGDNRTNSRDSRFIGAVPEDQIVGRSMLIIWPLNRLSTM